MNDELSHYSSLPSRPHRSGFHLTPRERESLGAGAAGGAALGAVISLSVVSSSAAVIAAPIIVGLVAGAVGGAALGHVINGLVHPSEQRPDSTGGRRK
jgi:hypothetical protein